MPFDKVERDIICNIREAFYCTDTTGCSVCLRQQGMTPEEYEAHLGTEDEAREEIWTLILEKRAYDDSL